jgi:hypothetical protein
VCAAHLFVVCGLHTNVFMVGPLLAIGRVVCNGLGDTATNGTNRCNTLWIWPHALYVCLACRVTRSKHASPARLSTSIQSLNEMKACLPILTLYIYVSTSLFYE